MHVTHSLGRWIAEECASHIAPDVAAAITEIVLEIEAARSGQVDPGLLVLAGPSRSRGRPVPDP
jgi:hypothetical protein